MNDIIDIKKYSYIVKDNCIFMRSSLFEPEYFDKTNQTIYVISPKTGKRCRFVFVYGSLHFKNYMDDINLEVKKTLYISDNYSAGIYYSRGLENQVKFHILQNISVT